MPRRSLPHARSSERWIRHALQAAFLLLIALSWPRPAHAYAWMIRHGYTQCGQCHVDPSGAGALTRYGRNISDSLLRTSYSFERPSQADQLGNFLFGAVELPDELDFGGDVRLLSLHEKREGAALQHRLIWMQIEGKASIQAGRVVGSATLGYAPEGALGAAVTGNPDKNLVSREHWLGMWLDEDHGLLLRAGRMNLPFGVRSIEHALWARVFTGADINDSQQYGLSASYASERFRGELMGIAGSLQVRPDVFRQRGYSAFGEYQALPTLTLGASSKIVHVTLDSRLLREEWKHAHGVFGRWATPWQPLVLLSEWDYVLESPKYALRTRGVVGYAQADIEATQGVHLLGTFEGSGVTVTSAPTSFGLWLSYAWFFAPHADLRLDNVFRSVGTTSGHVNDVSFLIQGHVSL